MSADVLGAIADLLMLVALFLIAFRLLKLEKRFDDETRMAEALYDAREREVNEVRAESGRMLKEKDDELERIRAELWDKR